MRAEDHPDHPGWAAFREAHADWLGRLPGDEPVYRLPPRIIAVMAAAKRLDDRAVEAERALNLLCRRSKSVGFLQGAPLTCGLLAPRAKADLRLRGFAGWPLTEPDFLRELQELRERWNALGPNRRPGFPPRCKTSPEARGAVSGFAPLFADFGRRWGLAGATWWDLPIPQGLVVSGEPSTASTSQARGVHVFIPFHHPLGGGEDLVRRVRRARRKAQAAGPDLGPAGLPRHGAFARIFEVQHWERVVAARYRPDGRAAGFVSDLVRAIARHLGLKENQVDKWRKAASARRRDVPTSSIPPLRPRP